MQHGIDTNSGRDLDSTTRYLGEKRLNQFLSILNKNPHAVVLDVGCGQGKLLEGLQVKFPHARFYGLDSNLNERDQDTDSKITYIAQSIEFSLPQNLKFDLIISVATFPYIVDITSALQNIARALKPNGRAFLDFEPFYLGPHGVKMLQKPGQTEWNGARDTLTVYPGDGHTILQNYYRYPFPLIIDLTQKLAEMGRLLGKCEVRAVNWQALEFLKVKSYNPLGSLGAGEGDRRAFILASTRFYSDKKIITCKEAVDFIFTLENYDPGMLKDPYVPSDHAKDVKRQTYAYLAENPALANTVLPKGALANTQRNSRGQKNACTFYSLATVAAAVSVTAGYLLLGS